MADDNRPHDLYSALDSASTVMALSSQDWGAAGDFAWLYGIFVGWDNDPTGGDVDQDGGALDELATRFRWDAETVARLRRLRAAVAAFDINAVGDLAGRLLPSGGEEQYRIVWSGQEGTYVDGEIDDLQDGLDHLAIIRGLSFVKQAHLERRILTDWSPVVSDNSEEEGS